jgi:hypothetical protein
MTSDVHFSFSTNPSGWLTILPNNGFAPYAIVQAGATAGEFTVEAKSNPPSSLSIQVTATCGFGSASGSVTIYPSNDRAGPCPDGNCEGNVGHPINLTNGNVWVAQRDYSLPGLGGGLEVVRTWNSLWPGISPPFLIGMFGRSWVGNYEERLVNVAGKPLEYWRGDGSNWSFLWNASGNN